MDKHFVFSNKIMNFILIYGTLYVTMHSVDNNMQGLQWSIAGVPGPVCYYANRARKGTRVFAGDEKKASVCFSENWSSSSSL